jgi:hypothetical protein
LVVLQENNKQQSQHVDGNIMNETSLAIAALSTRLPWDSYQSLITRLLKVIGRKQHIATFVVKIVCAMLRRFPFVDLLKLATPADSETTAMDVDVTAQQAKKAAEEQAKAKQPEEAKKEEEEKEEEAEEDDEDEDDEVDEVKEEKEQDETDASKAVRIRHTLLHRTVPQLTRYLTDPADPSRVVRPNVALAIVHILSMFPESLDLHLPPVITSAFPLLPASHAQSTQPSVSLTRAHSLDRHCAEVCQNMRNRLESVREVTREALRGMLSQLGVRFLGYVIKSLQVVLTKGFELHVLGHAVHDFLQHLAGTLKPGDLDYLVADIVPILVEHLLGDVAHQKDVEAIKRKTREARQQTLPYHAYQILAKSSSFSKLPELIEPLREHLEYTFSLDEVKKITEILRYIAQGLTANHSAKPTDVLIYAHSLLDQFLLPTHGVRFRWDPCVRVRWCVCVRVRWSVCACACELTTRRGRIGQEEEGGGEEARVHQGARGQEEGGGGTEQVSGGRPPGPRRQAQARAQGEGRQHRRTRRVWSQLAPLRPPQTYVHRAITHAHAHARLIDCGDVIRVLGVLSSHNPDHVSMLDPFLGMLVTPLCSLPDRSALLSLKCIGALVRMKTLPSAPTNIPMLIDNVLRLLRQGEVESKIGQVRGMLRVIVCVHALITHTLVIDARAHRPA